MFLNILPSLNSFQMISQGENVVKGFRGVRVNGYIHKIKSQGCTLSKDFRDCLF
jgi:hypothetical protein